MKYSIVELDVHFELDSSNKDSNMKYSREFKHLNYLKIPSSPYQLTNENCCTLCLNYIQNRSYNI